MTTPSPSPAELAEQLRYVREAVETRDRPRDPSLPLAILWAGLTTAGFALIDLRPEWVGWYWLTAGPLGMAVSGWLARRARRFDGVRRRGDGKRQALHWGSIFAAWIAVIAIAIANNLTGPVVGQIMTLVVGLVWFLGGLHLDRRFLIPGALLIVGSALVTYVPFLPWTLLGAVVGAALIVAAARSRISDDAIASQS